ncbi:hypothetical protein [Bacillus phage SBSphiJ6]|nr:hypothetical protein [Bacillus phage SBSphiJ6]
MLLLKGVERLAKTELTTTLERMIYANTCKMGVFGCFEVTIGMGGNERVDYITYDTKGIWRCYEIKVSVSDFRSTAKKTFCGHYNYYVMPKELYDKVKDEIPAHIGVYIDGSYSVKRAKKQELSVDEQVLKDSLIRSLYREADRVFKSQNPNIVASLKKQVEQLKKEKFENYLNYRNLQQEVVQKFGIRWREHGEEFQPQHDKLEGRCLRKALIKETVKDNYDALKNLSDTESSGEESI